MNKIHVLLVVLAASPFATHDAKAQTTNPDTGWYAAVQGGTSGYDRLLRGDSTWWSNVDDRDGTLAVGIGYDFVPGIGLRLMHERTSELTATNSCPAGEPPCPAIFLTSPTEVSNWSLVARSMITVAERWDLYATLGFMQWKLRPDAAEFARDSGTALIYGPGFSYRFDDTLGIGVEYQRASNDYSSLRATFTIRL